MPETNQAKNLWFKDSIIYSLHIRSFYDSNGSGNGDIQGLIKKLDYLDNLGINCISLMPFYDSPLKDDGYDITDFRKVHTDYGSLDDFKLLLDEAHKRDIRIVIDIILNHTSNTHKWFQAARLAPADSPERDYYVWSNDQKKYTEASVLFNDYENSNWEWDNEAQAYYWHRFYAHQPDLNYDNPAVRKEMEDVINFWATLGVDGFRLTSVVFLFERDGTNCENLPEVHNYLKSLRAFIDDKFPGKIIIGDTNLWPEEAAEYFGNGDECQMNYHFPLMPRLYMALQTEDRYPIIDILEQTPKIPKNAQWALFLRNHDDLMLSMVTEEERDYLYKVFAQDHGAKINDGIRRRLAPLLGNDRRKLELLHCLLFSLPGSPVIYYGDEIGMGDNIFLGDRKGVRTPMQWNGNQNAGFSTANPQKLFLPIIRDPLYRYETVNVEIQNSNPSSFLWWMKNIISMRKRLKSFSQGAIEFLESDNSKILAFTRSIPGESILILSNLSKYSQAVSLKLEKFKGIKPTEIFSQNKFFEITEAPYSFTLGPYGYYWFQLESIEEPEERAVERVYETIQLDISWDEALSVYTAKRIFEKKVLPDYLMSVRWFSGKSKKIVALEIEDFPRVPLLGKSAYLLKIGLRYTDGLPESYSLPAMFITDTSAIEFYLKKEASSVICHLHTPNESGILIDAIYNLEFRNTIFNLIQNQSELQVNSGLLQFEAGKVLETNKLEKAQIKSEILRAEQSNTSVIYNDQYFFKIYRKLDTDINPDLELVRFLSEKTSFDHAPKYGGGIQLIDNQDKSVTILGLLQNKIPNQGEAWTMFLEILNRYYEKILTKVDRKEVPPALLYLDKIRFEDIPDRVQRLIGSVAYERVVLLAQRTAEMHIALASKTDDPDFKPEPFSQHYQRSIYSGHRKLVSDKLNALENRLSDLPGHIREEARQILALREDILECFSEIFSQKIQASKTRIHGDYHLGQVLFNGRDYYIIDFEGEPMQAISERRLMKTPFKDVAGMIRSFHYAAFGQLVLNQNYRKEDMQFLEAWAEQWFHYISQAYLTAYLETATGQEFIPPNRDSMLLLLRNYTLEKAIYEVGYEMNARPEWLRIPIRGVLYAMKSFLENKP